MSKNAVLAIVFACFAIPAASQDYFEADSLWSIPKTSYSVTIDGVLDPVWRMSGDQILDNLGTGRQLRIIGSICTPPPGCCG